MCEVNGKQFYIYEPVQLVSHEVVIPIFLYKSNTEIKSKCVRIKAEHIKKEKHITEGVTTSIIKITVPFPLPFYDPRLSTIPVTEFDSDYSTIRWVDGKFIIDACKGFIYEQRLKEVNKIPFPNPWRVKANGKIIRHCPIVLYSDDTSGNVSKQFNKHISFYFTLAGLPPHISNQEYNCHFLATSNLASVCEMLEMIVKELNELATVGFEAYDHSISQVVLVTSTVLCFVADSPMHVEITNTPNPGASLNPCRMCTLCVSAKRFRKTHTYVQHFVQRDMFGRKFPRGERHWETTKSNTHKLFNIATTESNAQYIRKGRKYGLKDTINNKFIIESKSDPRVKERMENFAQDSPHRLYNPILELIGFDGVKDTPVEILHVVLLGVVKYLARDLVAGVPQTQRYKLIARLESFNCQSLNIDSLKPDYLIQHIKSLVGRDFKIIIQAAPFVFSETMTPDQKEIWFALCKLTPFIFQTKIANEEDYLADITNHIHLLIYHLIKSTAQWVNKPKIHMLLHLPDSIRRFGPPSLVSTEKFESYNGVLRKASIHSNRMAPGRDLATSFDNYSSIRFLTSGGTIYDPKTSQSRGIGDDVTSIFSGNKIIQQSMGYNFNASHPLDPDQYPAKTAKHHIQDPKLQIPQQLENPPDGRVVTQVAQIQINKHDRLDPGVFVVVGNNTSDELGVGEVQSLWQAKAEGMSPSFFCKVNVFKLKGVDAFYEMRQLKRTSQSTVVNARFIQGCINVQHNCCKGNCSATKTKAKNKERQTTGDLTWEVTHNDQDHYIINASSLHDPTLHQMISKLPVRTLQDQEWVDAISQGLAVWNDQDEDITSDEDEDEDADAADEVNSSDEEDEEGDDDAEGETE
ncbi:hypothetical protein PGT21_014993 [Puccinia graminis f. sp. tritici]|uniref:Uncharacterized protein n=1 Tax=Puccinia graminis f. sp. tritici TaxID=56615 RepID=A0A5B0QN13_PUCGR|nr:hypothetical protein PGT21_014993 [Puccinia graminis f. sp. tritici]